MFKDNFCIFLLGPYFSHFFVCPSETGDDYLKVYSIYWEHCLQQGQSKSTEGACFFN